MGYDIPITNFLQNKLIETISAKTWIIIDVDLALRDHSDNVSRIFNSVKKTYFQALFFYYKGDN